MESKTLERVQKIAKSKIPVSEECDAYIFFHDRKEICKTILQTENGVYKDVLFTNLSYCDNSIKRHLCLQ